MMERLREGANSLVVKIILSLIILSFVFAGVGSYLTGGGQLVAATVNGEEIDIRQFEQTFQQERNRMQQQGGEQFLAMIAEPAYLAQVRQTVLNQMINDKLIQQYAETLGLRVSDQQVREELLNIPAFHVDGRFDNDTYTAMLRRMGLTPDTFAEQVRADLRRQQLLSALAGSEFALDYEVETLSSLEQQTREVRTLTLSVSEAAEKVVLTDEELEAYYQQNSYQFTRPDEVKVAYIELSAENMADTSEVTDGEVEAYYETHLARFSTEEKRRLSHILFTGDDAAERADEALQRLKDGEDFAELASVLSADTFSAENGGDLDWIEPGIMDAAFDAAAFELAAEGDISAPVETDFGIHLIKVTDIQAAQATPMEEVRDEIIATLQQDNAVNAFYELRNALADISFEVGDSLADAAQATGTEVVTTDFISRQSASGVLADPRVLDALFSAEVREDGYNSPVIELDAEHVIVVRVDDYRYEEVLPLAEVKEQAESSLAMQRAREEVQAAAEALVSGLNAGEAVDAEFEATETYTRMGPNWSVANAVFTQPKPDADSVYGIANDFNGDVIVFAVDSVTEGEVGDNLDMLSQQLLQVRSQQGLSDIVAALRSAAKVTTNIN
ncbi:peptidylprolyl isomerase [Thaumasiovibrio sp. DFM-14]|uniref:peptidylprolyl isomerase n=1 Tax=Thaumasiovibrio sp. DFM-14 TaxID=3384792 RepID=UPI0039A3331B